MISKQIMNILSTMFEGIELVVRSRISDDIKDEIFNDEYNNYLSNTDFTSNELKKSLEKLLRKAEKNYTDAKKLYYSGKISSDDLYEYKRRINEILNEINNLNT